jgi:hypothetical protein
MKSGDLIHVRTVNAAVADGNPDRNSLQYMAFIGSLQRFFDKQYQVLERTLPGTVLDEQRPIGRIQIRDSRKRFCPKTPEQALNPVIHQTVDPVREFHAESRIAARQIPGRII